MGVSPPLTRAYRRHPPHRSPFLARQVLAQVHQVARRAVPLGVSRVRVHQVARRAAPLGVSRVPQEDPPVARRAPVAQAVHR